MPPAAVKTIRDQIFWQYAKMISKSAGLSNARAFQMDRFVKLRDNKIVWSSTIREWLHEHENPDACIYCGAEGGPLTTEHILSRCCGGPGHSRQRDSGLPVVQFGQRRQEAV